MKEVVSNTGDAKEGGALGPDAPASDATERPSLFCSLDGVCVNPHDAIPRDTRDTFARNFMRHFAAALGESAHAA